MEILDPIYTKKHECQDCHKCIRECPVKAIRVQDGFSQVMPGLCVMCGSCVQACPNHAIQVRRDFSVAQALITSGRKVIASLDPSFMAQFPGVRPAQLIHAVRALGFFAVSETALGAELVSGTIATLMESQPAQVWISSACPSVVDFIAMYHPECQSHVVSVMSPLFAHCRLLRSHYGADIAIVSLGPCISKKKDADLHPELVDAVLTFDELVQWLSAQNIRLEEIAENEMDVFAPNEAQEGTLYAIEGGMAPAASNSIANGLQFMSFSGLANVELALKDIPEWKPDHNIFLEMTACAGSCINGPMLTSKSSVARRRYDVIQYVKPRGEAPRDTALDISWHYAVSPIPPKKYGELPLREALRWVGQYSVEDELDCGGCGYQSCRDFARALLTGNAQQMMCATYTRKLAQKKANALLRRMPAAVVIVDENLKIIECNLNFSQLFPGEKSETEGNDAVPIHGALPFANLFRRVLESDEDIVSHDIRFGRRIVNTSIFTIEPNTVVGAIFQDITEPTFQKDQIIGRAQQVIEQNLKTVQQIAYLLGENAADTEVILSSIVNSFRPEKADDAEVDGG
jgi:iron only hydrogenase large subunit-like protein